jgi:2-keto-4-pentenoate hydratase/2-oxohepta-3-ene-1,7-dioic acid hydratase in catechol pathway
VTQNIWCVGRNYAEHAKELGNAVPDASTSEPMIFLKSGSTIVPDGGRFLLPKFTDDVHHECEVAYRFNPNLELTEMTLALDLTARDVQSKLKSAGHPWTLAKSFKASCPLGPFVPASFDVEFIFKVNGEVRQHGRTSEMIHSTEKLRRFVIERFPVLPGDLLLTGTPKGVSRVGPGDRLEAEIPGVLKAHWSIDPT